MPKLIKKRSKKVGLPPGALIHIGEKRTEKVKISIVDYDESQFREQGVKMVEECFSFRDKPTVTWINIDGVHEVDIIKRLGSYFNLHSLILENIMDTGQRPKIEDFEDYIFIVLKMLYYSERENEIKVEQVSLILGTNFVISFQEQEGDVFNFLRDRIRNAKGRIRKARADYLAYALIDAIIDNYFAVLEKLGERIEDIEEEVVLKPTSETLQTIHSLKRDMMFIRKSGH